MPNSTAPLVTDETGQEILESLENVRIVPNDIVDNLATQDASKVLSANMGYQIGNALNNINNSILIKRIIKGYGNVTMNSNGYLQITPPAVPTGYVFAFAVPWNFGASNGHYAWGANGAGNYIYGHANDTITNVTICFIYVLSEHFNSINE